MLIVCFKSVKVLGQYIIHLKNEEIPKLRHFQTNSLIFDRIRNVIGYRAIS